MGRTRPPYSPEFRHEPSWVRSSSAPASRCMSRSNDSIAGPDAVAVHDRMAAIGTFDGGLYAVDRGYGRGR
jgi:hypothetical protein